jgi:hypothetical protein
VGIRNQNSLALQLAAAGWLCAQLSSAWLARAGDGNSRPQRLARGPEPSWGPSWGPWPAPRPQSRDPLCRHPTFPAPPPLTSRTSTEKLREVATLTAFSKPPPCASTNNSSVLSSTDRIPFWYYPAVQSQISTLSTSGQQFAQDPEVAQKLVYCKSASRSVTRPSIPTF